MKNRGNKIFFLLIAAFLVLVFVYQYYTPKKFIWRETYSKYDKQPFGSFVFDDVVSSSVGSYQIVDKTFYRYYYDLQNANVPSFLDEDGDEDEDDEEIYFDSDEDEDSDDEYVAPLPPEDRYALLVTDDRIALSDEDLYALMILVRQGNKVMLCLSDFPSNLCESLCVSDATVHYSYFTNYFERHVLGGLQRDSMFFGTDALHPEHIYKVYPHIHNQMLKRNIEGSETFAPEVDSIVEKDNIRCDSLRLEALAYNAGGDTLAMRFFIGAGELYLVATPLMFTNYGILDGENASYAFRLLSYLSDLPLIRLEAYGEGHREATTPLRYILSQPPLQWALYAALIAIILFMIFTAKRRQRIIPVMQPPANETLRFTQLIGNLYYQRKDHKDILKKKYLYFCAELKRTTGLDMQSGERDEDVARHLAERIGRNYIAVWPMFRELKYLLRDEAEVCENDMIRHINQMNEWTRLLS
jgi:hypothetical protein